MSLKRKIDSLDCCDIQEILCNESKIYPTSFSALKAVEDGFYVTKEKKTVSISPIIDEMETIVYSATHLKRMANECSKVIASISKEKLEAPKYLLTTTTTIDGIIEEYNNSGCDKIGALNFASAKNVGGGFLSGAKAQEEENCRCCALFHSLYDKTCRSKYFEENRRFCNSRATDYACYLDNMIYSKNVAVFRDSNYSFLEKPVVTDFVTAPAVNYGLLIKSREPTDATNVMIAKMMPRIRYVLSCFYHNKCDTLILGAWGAGVFKCDGRIIADLFLHVLVKEHYEILFKKIVFAVYSKGKPSINHLAFEDKLREYGRL